MQKKWEEWDEKRSPETVEATIHTNGKRWYVDICLL